MMGALVAVCLTLWTVAVVLWAVTLAAPHPEPVRLDLRVTVGCQFRVDVDGRCMVPQDLNGDGVVLGDAEMGS